MTEPISGLWWLPDHEDDAVGGILSTPAGERAKLELIGSFRGIEELNQGFSPEIILGLADGKRVTLYKSVRTGVQLRMPGVQSERYTASYVLLGIHFSSAEDIRFARMSHEYDALFEWAGVNGIGLDIRTNAQGHLEEVQSRFAFPDQPEFDVGAARIAIASTVNTRGGPHEPRFELSQTVALRVTPSEPLSLETYLRDYFYDLGNFLALGVGGPVRTTRVTGDVGEGRERITVDILFRGRGRHVRGERRRWDMLFTLPDLQDEAATALERWLTRAERLRPVYDLYFATVFQERPYVHQRFLSLAQALESYHRRVLGGTYLEPARFDTVLEELANVFAQERHGIDRDTRAALTGKLRYLNEVSLRKRLKELVRARPEVVRILIRDDDRFVERVVNTRNYYTHYDDDLRARAVSQEHLSLLSDQMQFLLELCFFGEMGLSDDTMRGFMQEHQRYLQLRQALTEFDPPT